MRRCICIIMVDRQLVLWKSSLPHNALLERTAWEASLMHRTTLLFYNLLTKNSIDWFFLCNLDQCKFEKIYTDLNFYWSKDLCKIRSNTGDKKNLSCVDAEKKLNDVYGDKYRIRLDHEILTDHGVFYPQALYSELISQLTLAPATQVVKGSDASKLNYRLTNIEPEYEMIRSKALADEADSVYKSGKEFCLWSRHAGRSGHIFKRRRSMVEHSGQSSAPIAQGNPFSLRWTLYWRCSWIRKILQPRHHQSERYSERFAQQGLQQRHRGERHVARDQPVLCKSERKKQHDSYKVLHK